MSTFNTTRFGQALKCQFLVLRKTWIRLFGIFTLVMFMANLFFTRVNGVKYDDMVSQWPMEDVIIHYGNYVGSTTGFGVIFFCFSMLFGASFLFAGMKDTRKRSAFLLWPVSNLEKYIISLLLSILWLAVITIGAYLLADTLRVFIDWVTGRVVIWGLPKIIDGVFGPAPFEHWQIAWMLFAWVFYIHSLYIVGGTLFHRQQFHQRCSSKNFPMMIRRTHSSSHPDLRSSSRHLFRSDLNRPVLHLRRSPLPTRL